MHDLNLSVNLNRIKGKDSSYKTVNGKGSCTTLILRPTILTFYLRYKTVNGKGSCTTFSDYPDWYDSAVLQNRKR